MAAVASRDELRGYPNAIAGLANAPFEDVGDIEDLGDPADVFLCFLECERRRSRDDLQSRRLDQQVDDLFRQAIAEVFALRIRAQVREGSTAIDDWSLAGRPTAVSSNAARTAVIVGNRRAGSLQTPAHNRIERGRSQTGRLVPQHRAQHRRG